MSPLPTKTAPVVLPSTASVNAIAPLFSEIERTSRLMVTSRTFTIWVLSIRIFDNCARMPSDCGSGRPDTGAASSRIRSQRSMQAFYIGGSQLDQSGTQAPRDRLGATGRLEFSENGRNMEFDRVFGNTETIRDLPVCKAVGEEPQHLRLSWC